MSNSPNLNLPYLQASQSQKHVTVNDALQTLDSLTHLSVKSATLSTPPLSPSDGDRYIVANTPTDAWANNENSIAAWMDNTWMFLPPRTGWRTWVEETQSFLIWTGLSWDPEPTSATELQNIEKLGVNGQANAINRLLVKTPSILLNHETDDIRANINKAGSQNTASLLFQANFVGHAEVGLMGDNDLHIKVSPDGNTWSDAVIVDQTSAECLFQAPLSLPQFSKNNLPSPTNSGRIIYVNDATGGATPAFTDGTSWKRTHDNTTIN